MIRLTKLTALAAGILVAAAVPLAQQTPQPPANPQAPAAGRGGAPVQGAEVDIALTARFDRNGDKRLDYTERTAARQYLSEPACSSRNQQGPRALTVSARTASNASGGPAHVLVTGRPLRGAIAA